MNVYLLEGAKGNFAWGIVAVVLAIAGFAFWYKFIRKTDNTVK